MTGKTPLIQGNVLTYRQAGGQPAQLSVDTADWYAWLDTASIFLFQSEHGTFTARKEPAGNRRGGEYWKAYRRHQRKLYRAYLGKSEDLTLEHLQSVAVILTSKGEGEDVPDLRAGTRTSTEASARTRRQRRIPAAHRPLKEDLSETWSARFPVSLTPLIGREQEVQAISKLLLQPEVRLLTITGTGGTGKTRLALEVARAVSADFTDGICFVPLAPVRDAIRVIAAIAQALGLWEATDIAPEEQVQAALRDRHLLLLLDNFEQVVKGASQLISLLTSCPDLRLLITSRAALHLSVEQEFLLQPLAVPDLSQPLSVETLVQQPSVRLFVQRTQALQPSFALTSANATAIAAICVRLDGLPLALELAAARIKLLPPQALLKRLSHRLEVLTGGTQDLPIRQQTLRNTLQWSYNLLSQEEQRLFRWLSIFVGGCTLEAVEAVCQPPGEPALSALEGAASLLDKSLIQQVELEGEEPRLVMLETIREFGLECLQRQGELQAARQAHAHYFVKLAEQAEPGLFSIEQPQWCDRLEQELDNLRAIFQAALTGEKWEVELALRLASALRMFWAGRGYLHEGRSVLDRLLANSHANNVSIRLKALSTLGTILWVQSDVQRLAQIADEAMALAQEQKDQRHITRALILRGIVMMLDKRDYAQAQECLEEALNRTCTFGDFYNLIVVLLSLGRLALYQKDASQVIFWLEKVLIQCRSLGEKLIMSMALVGLAQAESSRSQFGRAHSLLKEALTVYQDLGNTWGIAQVLNLLGQLAIQQGELSQAEAFLADSTRLASEIGDRRNGTRSRLLLAGLFVLRGEFRAARQWYEEGLSVAIEGSYMSFIGSGLKGLGCVAALLGLYTWAAILWGAAEPLQESSSVSISADFYERMLTVVRSQLGKLAFAQVIAEGGTMTPSQALASPERFSTPVEQPLSLSQVASSSSLTTLSRHPVYPAGLTTREVEVLRLLAQGMTNPQIAERLILSLHTVNAHVRSIYTKLELNSRSAVTRYALEQHLL